MSSDNNDDDPPPGAIALIAANGDGIAAAVAAAAEAPSDSDSESLVKRVSMDPIPSTSTGGASVSHGHHTDHTQAELSQPTTDQLVQSLQTEIAHLRASAEKDAEIKLAMVEISHAKDVALEAKDKIRELERKLVEKETKIHEIEHAEDIKIARARHSETCTNVDHDGVCSRCRCVTS